MAKTPISPNLDWVTIKPKTEVNQDEGLAKLFRKCKKDPLIPIGMTATVAALTYGLYSFYQRDSQKSQLMMRARIVAQGFTVAAIVFSLVAASKNTQEQVLIKSKEQTSENTT